MNVTFRPRLTPYVTNALFITMVMYVAFRLFGSKLAMLEHPFAIAAAFGGVSLAWNLFARRAKHGIRADANGMIDINASTTIKWNEVTAIKLDVEQVPFANGQFSMRVATIEAGEKTIRFADLGPGRAPRAGTIVNIEAAGVMLAIVAAHTKAKALCPPSWSDPEAVREHEVPAKRRVQIANLGGVVALALKVGPKVVGIVVKLVKSIKLGSVAVAIGAYSLIWSWQFAVALVGMVLVHECGHVFAMWRSGVPVKGIYFIPFFGGAAVGKGVAKTRAKSAYIAINGPIWGTLLAFACFAGYALTGERMLLAAAAWGALLNLFNLLPIFPLDGGRIVASLANASPRGVPIVVGSFALGIAVAYFRELELLSLIGLIGLFELGQRLTVATYAPALAVLGRELTADEHEQFSRHVAFVAVARNAPSFVEHRKQTYAALKAEAQQTPMTFRQGVLTLLGYLVVFGALVGLLVVTAELLGPGNPLDLLR